MTEPKEGQAAGGAQQIQVQVRDEKAHTMYTNMWTVRPTHSAEEIIIDFGMAIPSAERQDAMTLDVQSRVILNYFSAKRLALQLSQVVQRYEQQFGTVELDVRKRLKKG
jgi:hypothetical protein